MRLKEFKKQLKHLGIPYESVKKNFDLERANNSFSENLVCLNPSLEDIVCLVGTASEMINRMSYWEDTAEGDRYWRQRWSLYFYFLEKDNKQKKALCHFLGDILGYETSILWYEPIKYTVGLRTSKTIRIGCTNFSLELLDKAFKVAIDQLGYELK